MNESTNYCPHCGAKLRTALFLLSSPRQHRSQRQRGGPYQSTQAANGSAVANDWRWAPYGDSTPPAGKWKSLWHFMRGGSWVRGDRKVYVDLKIQKSRGQLLLDEYQLPLTESQCVEVAKLYLGLKLNYSRPNTCEYTSLSQNAHTAMNKAFIRLYFVDKINARDYRLSMAGRLFLRNFYRPMAEVEAERAEKLLAPEGGQFAR